MLYLPNLPRSGYTLDQNSTDVRFSENINMTYLGWIFCLWQFSWWNFVSYPVNNLMHSMHYGAMEIKAIQVLKSTKLLHPHFFTKPDDFFFCKWCRTYWIIFKLILYFTNKFISFRIFLGPRGCPPVVTRLRQKYQPMQS